MRPASKKGGGPLAFSDFYDPFPRQRQFHESRAKHRLFGGTAGPGKTKALLWEAIRQALEVAGCDTLLLRRTYPELESSLLTYFRRDVPRALYKSYNESKHLVTWKNGSITRFGYCRNENDVYQYQGAEFLFIGIDERSEEHTSELQSPCNLVCRLLLEKKKKTGHFGTIGHVDVRTDDHHQRHTYMHCAN